MPDVRWTKRTDPLLVEVAEAIGCTTDLVMGMMLKGNVVYALATPRYPEDETMVKVALERDVLGILRVVSTETDPKFLDRMRAEIDERLGDGD